MTAICNAILDTMLVYMIMIMDTMAVTRVIVLREITMSKIMSAIRNAMHLIIEIINGLVQDYSNFSALAVELLQSYAEPSMYRVEVTKATFVYFTVRDTFGQATSFVRSLNNVIFDRYLRSWVVWGFKSNVNWIYKRQCFVIPD